MSVELMKWWPYLVAALAFKVVLWTLLAMSWRVVVPTNEVHTVQSRRKTISYGKDETAGNCYYKWPAWVPLIGIRTITLPVSVFDISLEDYAAYDKGRVPFVVDILAFFRITEPNVAAQRVSSFQELKQQLQGILQGASRSILAQAPIEEILEERAKYGGDFTRATDDQLRAWGVQNVKNIELMDIRDAQGSRVIVNIMAMKQSTIERDSRVMVANNKQAAQTAEINADQGVKVRQQEAEQAIGERTAEKDKLIGIAQQQAQQAIQEESKTTAEKTMAVRQVNETRAAEIERGVVVIQADRDKQAVVVRAEGEKQRTITIAEGTLGQAKLHAEGVRVEGEAKGAAEQAVLMAPVNSQIALAKEIGENPGYQQYLITIKTVEANQAVGMKQAEALGEADVKVIANTGNAIDGVKSAMELFTPKGGLQVGAALEALKNTDVGKALIAAVTNGSGHHDDAGH